MVKGNNIPQKIEEIIKIVKNYQQTSDNDRSLFDLLSEFSYSQIEQHVIPEIEKETNEKICINPNWKNHKRNAIKAIITLVTRANNNGRVAFEKDFEFMNGSVPRQPMAKTCHLNTVTTVQEAISRIYERIELIEPDTSIRKEKFYDQRCKSRKIDANDVEKVMFGLWMKWNEDPNVDLIAKYYGVFKDYEEDSAGSIIIIALQCLDHQIGPFLEQVMAPRRHQHLSSST